MRSINSQKGFSLIELMVSVSIFAIVMLIGTGAVLAIVNGNKKNQSMQVAISNLNYAVENMTRTMKTGRDFNLISSSEISLVDSSGNSVTYKLNKGSLEIDQGTGFVSVTAPEINIDTLTFEVIGTGSTIDGDFFQPAVIIFIEGTAYNNKESLSTRFALHTSVTQRAVDY